MKVFFQKIKNRFTHTQIIMLGLIGIIILGTFLLCLPISTRSGEPARFIDALFTATSATCVTGLIVQDTFSYWSTFGQLVILVMIQIGGLGLMTVICMFSIFTKRKIGIRERRLLMQSAGTMRSNGIIRLITKILLGTLLFEVAGAVVLASRFMISGKLSFVEAVYFGIFHSISAFCNAGFDLCGRFGEYSSLTTFNSDPILIFTVSMLIVIGGIGFFVWSDIINRGKKWKQYELHTKLVIVTTAILIIIPWIVFFLLEKNHSMAGMSLIDRIANSLFQAITPKTAGFNTIDLTQLSESGNLFTIILMFIGASPGSTGGGIKTTTFAVLVLAALEASSNRVRVTVFKRRIEDDAVKRAGTVATLYMFAVLLSTLVISAIESFPFEHVLFEAVSAACTVGLSVGVTAEASCATHLILALLMVFGRLGGLTLMLAFTDKRERVTAERPVAKIMIG